MIDIAYFLALAVRAASKMKLDTCNRKQFKCSQIMFLLDGDPEGCFLKILVSCFPIF